MGGNNINGKIFDSTKEFTSTELRKFFITLDNVLNTNVGSKYLKQILEYNEGRLPKNTDIDCNRFEMNLKLNINVKQR